MAILDDRFRPMSYNFDRKSEESKLLEKDVTKNGDGTTNQTTAVVPDEEDEYLKKLLEQLNQPPDFTQRDLARHDRIADRFTDKTSGIEKRMNNAYNSGNIAKGDKLKAKIEAEGASLGSSMTNSQSADWGGGVIAAAKAAPAIAAQMSQKPETQGEANAGILNMTMTGASIGTEILPGWGTAIGAAAGFTAGAINSSGMHKRNLKKADEAVALAQQNEIEERMLDFIYSKTSQQMEAKKNLLARTLGYSKPS